MKLFMFGVAVLIGSLALAGFKHCDIHKLEAYWLDQDLVEVRIDGNSFLARWSGIPLIQTISVERWSAPGPQSASHSSELYFSKSEPDFAPLKMKLLDTKLPLSSAGIETPFLHKLKGGSAYRIVNGGAGFGELIRDIDSTWTLK